MSLLDPDPHLSDLRRARREAERTVDRLRSMPISRLDRPGPSEGGPTDDDSPGGIPGGIPGDSPGSTPARQARELAQSFADAAADLAGARRRPLPDLPSTSAGDVLAVCAADLIAELERAPDPVATTRLSEALIELRTHL